MFPTRCRGTFITTEIFPLVSVGTSPSTESRREMDRFRIPQSFAARIDPSVFSNGISVKRPSRENLERKLERLRCFLPIFKIANRKRSTSPTTATLRLNNVPDSNPVSLQLCNLRAKSFARSLSMPRQIESSVQIFSTQGFLHSPLQKFSTRVKSSACRIFPVSLQSIRVQRDRYARWPSPRTVI